MNVVLVKKKEIIVLLFASLLFLSTTFAHAQFERPPIADTACWVYFGNQCADGYGIQLESSADPALSSPTHPPPCRSTLNASINAPIASFRRLSA